MAAHDAWEPPPDPNRRRASAAIARAAQARLRELWSSLPPGAGSELRAAIVRLRRSRSPRQAVSALEHEIEHLFENVAPTLVHHPFPVRTPARAYAMVAATAGTAAAVEEMEAIALLLPGVNAATAPTLPLIVAASFGALAFEAYLAASLRVHMLQAAGSAVDPASVTRDVLRAMTGREDVRVTKLAAKALTRRMLRRWSRGVVPLVGIGYAGWDAHKTIRAISRMPA
jgi:hypothetical protein